MQLPFSFFPNPISIWCEFISEKPSLGIIDPLHTLCCERGTHVAGALKCNLKMQLCGNLSVLECSDLLSCQAPLFFFFNEITS